MKQLAMHLHLYFGLTLIACAITGCKTTFERPQVCTVTDVNGEVRYWDGQSNKVHTIKKGDRVPPSSIIETAKGADNYISLAMGERLSSVYSNYPYIFDPLDCVKLYSDSALKLDKVILKTAGGNRTLDTRLVLLRGAAMLDPRPTLPAQFQKTKIIAPVHELRTSNMVIRAGHAAVWFTASGITRVLLGTATMERTDQGISKELTAWHEYDSITGEVSSIEENYENYAAYFGGVDVLPPETRPAPRFEIPKRPF